VPLEVCGGSVLTAGGNADAPCVEFIGATGVIVVVPAVGPLIGDGRLGFGAFTAPTVTLFGDSTSGDCTNAPFGPTPKSSSELPTGCWMLGTTTAARAVGVTCVIVVVVVGVVDGAGAEPIAGAEIGVLAVCDGGSARCAKAVPPSSKMIATIPDRMA
jgi:hypothetical protein